MAVLEKIRVKFGLAASIIIALGLLSFIIDPQELINAFQSMSSKYDVGNINGKKVAYNDFVQEVETMTRINELMTGSSAQSAQQQAQARNAAWQNLIYRDLFVRRANDAGIVVGEDEMVDLTTGNNLSPLIAQNPVFAGNDGSFSKDQLLSFVQNMGADETGNLRLYWNYLQNSISNQQYFQKYSSLFTAASAANAIQVRRDIEENNNTTDVDFVMVPYGYLKDSTVTVSDSEIRSYYNSHKNFFRQQASRDIEYVVFEVVPSEKDINAAKTEVADLYEEFATTDNMKAFLSRNSDRSLSDYWYKKGELSTVNARVEDYVWNGTTPVSDIIASGNKFYVARVMESRMIPDSAYVKHILLQGTDAEAKADSLLNVVRKGGSFSNLVAQYSDDQNSQADGELGNIGWMTQNYMLPGFESVLEAKKGEPFILKTQYGTHVVLVSNLTKPVAKKRVAIFEKEAIASKETFSTYYSQANRFATIASGSYANYRRAIDSCGVYSHPVNNLSEATDRFGAIDNAKEVTRWAFDNKVGKVSEIITVDNNFFFIATVKGIHKEGIATVEEVATQIKDRLYREKLGQKKAQDFAAEVEGLDDLQAIAEKLGSSVSSQSGVAFSSLTSQGSLDPAFIGALSVAPEGKLCGPVVGSVGIYFYKVTGRDTGAFFTEDDAKVRDAQMAQYNSQMIVPVMMLDADVKDNRARFF